MLCLKQVGNRFGGWSIDAVMTCVGRLAVPKKIRLKVEEIIMNLAILSCYG